MAKDKGSGKPSDLTKGSTAGTSPQLTERDLDQVSGGLKIGEVKGESGDVKHPEEIHVSSFKKP
jgi:hypothetical protein